MVESSNAEAPDRALLRLQHDVLAAAREYLNSAGFVELLPPILDPAVDPDIPGEQRVDRRKLVTGAVLARQAGLLAFDRTYCLASPAGSHRFEVEMVGATREQAMRLAEELVVHVAARVGVDLPEPFRRYMCADIDGAESRNRPHFVTDYERPLYGFDDRLASDGSGTFRNFELFLPDGPDRVGVGSEREHEYTKVLARIRETGQNPARYALYLRLVREGVPASAGFGLGVERLARCFAARDDIRRNCLETASPAADRRRDPSLASSASGI